MKLLREPLIHFVALGAVLFLVYAAASDVFSPDASRRIEIAASEIELLAATWQRRWQRPPTEQELRGLVEARVREEVLYREALKVGLDANDVVVRRRMVQKMELLSQDLALLADPTDRQLQSFFQERREEYRIPPRLSFSHVYFNMDERGPAGEEDARRVLAEIVAETPPPRRAPERGDRFMLEHEYVQRSPDEVRREFGERFATALFELESGWHGPIVSGFGLHLVYVGERVESRIPEYAAIRDQLVRDYNRVRSERAKEVLYEGLSERYEVEIDEEAVRRAALDRL
ncbi:MAG: peptidyl-prolyl cis-trans isomerase [Candidatus Latescibacterota bacterium]|nr:MAG: peptidyl-prolyl cis-trans isomerase [Candidatus Latescibacterota bacterium]